MLARLGHHTFVGGDHEQNHIDTARTGKHVLYKTLMPGDIDKTKTDVTDLHLRKSEIDRDTALFFLRKAIGVDAGQRFYERRLPMIDVSGCSDDRVHMFRR